MVVNSQDLGESAYQAKGQSAIAAQEAYNKQQNYVKFLFSKKFQPLV